MSVKMSRPSQPGACGVDARAPAAQDDSQLAHWAPKRRRLSASQKRRRQRWDVEVKTEIKTEAEEAAAQVVTPTTPPGTPTRTDVHPAGAATPPDAQASSDDEVTVVYEGPPEAPATPPECVTLSSDEEVVDRGPKEVADRGPKEVPVDGPVPLIWAVQRLLRAGAPVVHRTGDKTAVDLDWTVRPSTPMYATVNPVRYETLHPGTDEYEAIRVAFESTSDPGSGSRVTAVTRVENDRMLYLFQCQIRRLEELNRQAAVLRLFHGAPPEAIKALCRGRGVAAGHLFSPLSRFCAQHCVQPTPSRSMLVCDVVVSRVYANSRLREDQGRVCDSILRLDVGAEVLCKPAYALYQFCPAYLVHYEAYDGAPGPQPSRPLTPVRALITPRPSSKSQPPPKTQRPQKPQKPPQPPWTPMTPLSSPPSARWWT